jgi:large subunit ribosomal protein L18
MKKQSGGAARVRRHIRIRKQLAGSGARPRLAVFRSLQHIYAQVIDDSLGRTLVSASSLSPEIAKNESKIKKLDEAKLVGKMVAQKAMEAGVESVVFDRGGYMYHGRVKALAEAAREVGLKF